jgi:hypothetical protein
MRTEPWTQRTSARLFGGLLCAAAISACGNAATETAMLYRAPPVSNAVDGVVFESGNWAPHLAAGEEGTSWGNHRAVVALEPGDTNTDAVSVTIPWRRRDHAPELKSVVVVDAGSVLPVSNAVAVRVENNSGEVRFQPVSGSTEYHVYYMPWQSTGGYYPTVTYPDLAPEPEGAWLAMTRGTDADDLPTARATHIQSVDDFHSFFPMEVSATNDEMAAFMAGAMGGWRVVAEHRDRPIRMRHRIPQHWAADSYGAALESRVLKDEAFTFQVAVVAGDDGLSDVTLAFEDFPDRLNDAWTCFNCSGIDERGERFTKTVDVPAGEVQALWLGLRVPDDEPAGSITGRVVIASANRGSQSVPVSLEIVDARAVNGGADEPDLMTRLAWLDSKVGTDPDFIIDPFDPVRIEGKVLSILGREITLGANGLPESIESFFSPMVTEVSTEAAPILASPLGFEVNVGGAVLALEPEAYAVRQVGPGRAEWAVTSTGGGLSMTLEGALEYDGMLEYRVGVSSSADVSLDDISLPISLVPEAARYMLGLGRMGGARPAAIDWKWAVENHQEGVWLGGTNRGLQYVLRDDDYQRPLNTNFYQNQPLRMPAAWFNEGRGGISISELDGAVVSRNYSGPRELAAGDTLQFNVRFLITPFKPIDTQEHFETRFVHQYVPVDSVIEWGGTVVNIHHANAINPYINYPFFALDAQAAYIEEAHAKGIKVKLYNTIRELTYRAHELFALRSLGDEIMNDGEGGGHSWMQEHLEEDYHSAWHAWRVDDAAMLNKGTSRWTNYYIAGLEWLAENQHIDGLYLDDIAFSRATVKRLVSVLSEHRDEVVIDLHSANQFNPRDGFINSSMLYMEHFPFISRLWFGEYFDYNEGPDYWMTEVAGIPFGLMGEMLQDGGHPYRGLLYGMTARKYGNVDPRPVWAMMNDFGISESEMRGYWLEDAPVRTGREDVLATTYVRDGSVLIALASWSDKDEVVDLTVDYAALGLESDVIAQAAEVAGLQQGRAVDLSAVQIPAGQGLWIVAGQGN